MKLAIDCSRTALMKNLTVVILSLLATLSTPAQEKTKQSKPNPEQSPEVIRVNTDLVQTNVFVLDKQGHFVDGLQLKDFDLRIDGKPEPISFFNRVVAGTSRGQSQPAAVASIPNNNLATSEGDERGRTIIFFIDDLHLSAGSVQRTRQMILQFLTNQMGPGDQVAVASASGQIGFLQQFTDNRSVLRAAVSRLNHHPYTVIDSENIPMTEYTALRVDQGDRDAITYYANQLLLANNFNSPGGPLGPPQGGPVGAVTGRGQRSSGISREMAEMMVKQRALAMLKQASAVTGNTLLGLESLMHSSAQLAGRKLAFLVSDGFYLNDRNTGFVNKLHEITDAALRAGVVVYSIDARGLTSSVDVTTNRPDLDGKLSRSNIGELAASQDGLNALAEDTGGRALLNSDALNEAVDRALNETSNYYELAWKPATEDQKSGNFRRLQVSVVGHPELVVRVPRGYLESDANAAAAHAAAADNKTAKVDTKSPPIGQPSVETELRTALGAFAPKRNLPAIVALSFIDTPENGLIVTASIQAATAPLNYGSDGQQAGVDLAGVVLNDQGKPAASFKTHMTVRKLPANMSQEEAGVVYNYKTPLAPGLYQVRAALRDEKSGQVGSAMQWIEIPDLSSHRLTLSSLLVRAQQAPGSSKSKAEANAPSELQFSVDRRFNRASQLNFLLFIYNATRGSNGNSTPDVAAKVEVFRRGQTIVSTPVRKLSTEGMSDLGRIPYGGQFPLATLPIGRYDLQVTIADRLANSTASQRLSFQIE
jgi:VWFA-related protein